MTKIKKLIRKTLEASYLSSKARISSIMGIVPNPYVIYHVDPAKIDYYQTGELSNPIYTYEGRGAFNKFKPMKLSGNWDQQVTPVKDTIVYRGLKQRFIDDLPWHETELHPNNWRETHPNIGGRYFHRSLSEFERIAGSREKLYESMLNRGYLSQRELNQSFWNELTINIGRDGKLIRNSGAQHRLIFSRLLKLPSIPVRVLIIHSEWSGNVGELGLKNNSG